MRKDTYGRIILNEDDIINQLMIDPDATFSSTILVDKEIVIHPELELEFFTKFIPVSADTLSITEFDTSNQQQWNMPDYYQELDIAKWLLDQCETDAQRQRVGQELLLYIDRDLFPLLQYLKYLVDTMRKNNIVWGVGRGSSVSSYVLFLIGVHKIDSMYYDLDINEFLR